MQNAQPSAQWAQSRPGALLAHRSAGRGGSTCSAAMWCSIGCLLLRSLGTRPLVFPPPRSRWRTAFVLSCSAATRGSQDTHRFVRVCHASLVRSLCTRKDRRVSEDCRVRHISTISMASAREWHAQQETSTSLRVTGGSKMHHACALSAELQVGRADLPLPARGILKDDGFVGALVAALRLSSLPSDFTPTSRRQVADSQGGLALRRVIGDDNSASAERWQRAVRRVVRGRCADSHRGCAPATRLERLDEIPLTENDPVGSNAAVVASSSQQCVRISRRQGHADRIRNQFGRGLRAYRRSVDPLRQRFYLPPGRFLLAPPWRYRQKSPICAIYGRALRFFVEVSGVHYHGLSIGSRNTPDLPCKLRMRGSMQAAMRYRCHLTAPRRPRTILKFGFTTS